MVAVRGARARSRQAATARRGGAGRRRPARAGSARRSRCRCSTSERSDGAAARVLRAPARGDRGEPDGHDRRHRHRVPARLPRRRCGARARCSASSSGCFRLSGWPTSAPSSSWLQQATGDARDLDVYVLEFDSMRALVPEPMRADLEPLLRRCCATRRRTARRSMVRALRSERTTLAADRLGRVPRRARAAARGRAPRRGRADRRRGGRADPQGLPPDGQDGHRDRRRQPGRGLPRAAQARQGAALPARAVRRAAVSRRRWSSR